MKMKFGISLLCGLFASNCFSVEPINIIAKSPIVDGYQITLYSQSCHTISTILSGAPGVQDSQQIDFLNSQNGKFAIISSPYDSSLSMLACYKANLAQVVLVLFHDGMLDKKVLAPLSNPMWIRP